VGSFLRTMIDSFQWKLPTTSLRFSVIYSQKVGFTPILGLSMASRL